MNRRGNVFDSVGIIITLFTVGILCLIGVVFIQQVYAGITSSTGIPATATNMVTDMNTDVGWVLDFFILMMLLAMPVASMLLAFFNNIHPLFFWASIGITMLVIIIGSAFGDAFVGVMNSDGLSAGTAVLPMSSFIFSHFGMYSLFVILLIAAGVFVKSKSAGGYA